MVLGASGGVGAACVQLAQMIGAEVLAFAGSQPKLERLTALGAAHVANYTRAALSGYGQGDLRQTAHQRHGRRRCGGEFHGWGYFARDAEMREDGRPHPLLRSHRRVQSLARCALLVDLRAHDDRLRRMAPRRTWSPCSIWWRGGRLAPLIDKVLPLEQTAEGERLLEDREVVGKVLIKP
jgi:alcohol dehydrogenase